MSRRLILAVVLVLCGAAPGFAQALSPKDGASQLQSLWTAINRDAADLTSMSIGLSRDCASQSAYHSIISNADLAVAYISGTQDMLDLYSVISSEKDRAIAAPRVVSNIARTRQQLEIAVKGIGGLFGFSDLPAAAATLVTRMKDNVRSAMSVLDRVSFAPPTGQ